MDYGSHSKEGSGCKVHLRTEQYRRDISSAFNLLFPSSAIRVYNFPFPLVVLHTVLHAGVFLSSLYHLYYTPFIPSEAVCPPRMKVAVIGAGPSGLVTLKYLLTAHQFLDIEPIEARIFESEDAIGGTFYARTYEDAEVQPSLVTSENSYSY